MLKTKYYYNPATCSYERVQTPLSVLILHVCLFLLFSLGLAIAIARYAQGYFASPREEELLQANEKFKAYYRDVQKKIERSAALLNMLQEHDNELYRVLLNTAPRSFAERSAGMGGVNKYAHLAKDTLIAQTLSKVDQLISQLTLQKQSYDEIRKLAKKNKSRLQSTPTLPPISKDHLKRISAAFGIRIHPIYKIRRMHKGVDFAAPIGAKIYAAADGYVKLAKQDRKGYGNCVLLEHGNGFQSNYAHMHTIMVKPGQRVTRGQQIGTVGNSGDATGPHLHYEVYFNGRPVDPLQYFVGKLTVAEYEAVCNEAKQQKQALCSNF